MMNNSNESTFILYNPVGLAEIPYKITQCVLASTFNLLALISLIRMNTFSYSNLLFMLLCVSDLIIGIAYSPLVAINMIFFVWPLGNFVCSLYSIFAYSQFVVSNNLIFLMSIHRCLLLNRPFETAERITKHKLLLIASFWLAPYVFVGFAFLAHVLSGSFDFGRCIYLFSFNYTIIQDVLLYFVPSVTSVGLNVYNIVCLIRNSRRRRKIMGRNNQNESSSTNNSSAREMRRRKLFKSLRPVLCILFIVLNIFVTEYPFLILWPWTIKSAESGFSYEIYAVYYFSLRLLNCFPIVNPIILLLFNNMFKKSFCDIMRKLICAFKN